MDPLRVMLVDSSPDRARLLEAAITADGHAVITTLGPAADLYAEVQRLLPDMVIVDMDIPDRDVLEHMRSISRDQPRPVVMFSGEHGQEAIADAVRAGVSAYVVDGLDPRRLGPIMEVAIARFREFQTLRQELEQTRLKLSDRREVERAKGLLMQHRKLSERDAFNALRKLAMDRNQRLGDAARNVIAVFDALG